ncbi:heme lyase CcmF/NrfE family subunit [Solidesulfovibrio sp.]|uniref:heme lyase CcmF/NrfE family subunit n=1 Tax=Solidesulfovibrio sp. TaxID=2910990 RepID=UPI002B20481D|nr:cytochrome c-type biogenesis CcmF C-terminal domain-containing protein [Solidesulfovibrio sp.]MEA5089937.1 cytochrome c-type biogenesis CcmF C-terminal domain-containing protein [Solidesulfovibrio sp.]HML61929.1 cytochrome c-type biogenesis CcmF C-terminal domain-containing protein [Solidesulfovibrio sp.]
MHVTAYFALLVAMLVCLAGAATALFGLWKRDALRLPLLERAHHVVFVATLLASAILTIALWRRDFSFVYVAEYTDTLLPLFYAVTAFWAGQAGSLLFWMLALAVFGAGFALSRSYRDLGAATRCGYWLFFFTIEAFFLLMLTGPSNPFLEAVPPLAEGRGLNPLLRNPGMIFHPPLLFLGYAGFAIPACLALSGWLVGEKRPFAAVARNTVILSWIFLTAGIILGGWWSYMELGWGGYWAWDPVENASLIPWLVGTAFLHTAIVERRTKALPKTNVAMAVITFVTCILGTYLVRSGVVDSLHAFGEGGVGGPLLIFMIFALVVLGATLMAGAPLHEGRFKPLATLVSVPGFLVILAWLMLALSGVVLLGTMWPVISKLWSANPVGLDAGFYNRVCLPLFAVVTFLVAFCPLMSWTEGLRDRTGLGVVLGALVGGGAVLYAVGLRLPVALFAGAASVAALACALYVFLRHRHARSLAGALGAYCVHVGLALVTLGVAFSGPYQISKEAVLTPGRTMEIGGFTLTFKDIEQERNPAMTIARAVIDVQKDGKTVGQLAPERRVYKGFEQPFAEVSTIPSLGDEIYATLLSATDKKAASIKISVNPLVNWVWIGGTIMCLAPFLSLRRPKSGAERI